MRWSNFWCSTASLRIRVLTYAYVRSFYRAKEAASEGPSAGFTPTGNFSFSSPPPASATANGKAKKGFAVPSSSEEDDSEGSEEESDSEEEREPEVKETPDDELSPEQKLERAEQRKLAGNEFCE